MMYSTVDSITDGSNLKKRNLPTNDTSGSQSIASRVKGLGRAVKKKKSNLLILRDLHNINNSSTLFYCWQFCLGNSINYTYGNLSK